LTGVIGGGIFDDGDEGGVGEIEVRDVEPGGVDEVTDAPLVEEREENDVTAAEDETDETEVAETLVKEDDTDGLMNGHEKRAL